MQIVNMHEAKTHLSRLVMRAAAGESFIIARAGKPLVRVVAIDEPTHPEQQRVGFMAGQLEVPEDFDTMNADDIAAIFDVR